jgi:hypothetical protein
MKKMAALIILTLFTLQAGAGARTLLGRVERGLVEDKKITVKLDTGAKTSSLHAIDIEPFEKDDEDWVRFKVPLKKGVLELERPLVRSAKIKNRSHEQFLDEEGDMHRLDERPVVKIKLCLADQQQEIEVSLTDRSEFNYPLLLGRSAMLQFNVVIDPQEIYTQEPHCKKTPE